MSVALQDKSLLILENPGKLQLKAQFIELRAEGCNQTVYDREGEFS